MIVISKTLSEFDVRWVGMQLRATYWGRGYTDKMIEEAMKKSVNLMAHYLEGEESKPVGYLRAVSDHAICTMITDLIVDPFWRDQGVGRKLMDAVLKLPETKHTGFVLASCDAQPFYRKFGFKTHSDTLMIRPFQ
jgi:ribosomal protein S18 acetylase RimI-like enzyme